MLTFDCHGLERNFVGSFVVIRFQDKNFNAHVQLANGSNDPRQALSWYEQSTAPIPYVFKRGVINGTETVDVNGSDVPPCFIGGNACPGGPRGWDLGLDKAFGTTAGLPATVSVVITITLIPG